MQHIPQIELPTLKQSRGGRIGSSKLRHSLEQCEDFTGLEGGVNRYDLLLLVKRAGKGAGFTAKMVQLLDYYMAFTRDIDWEEGARPIVYQSLSRTALDLGISERQIQRIEQALFEAGALTWNDSGNHRRYGQRCPETGMILYAYGVDLTPLAYLQADLQAKLQEKRLYDQAWMKTKRQISWYRRQIKACLSEALEQGTIEDQTLLEWNRGYEDIALQIRTYIKLESLRALLGKHKDLHTRVLNDLDQVQKTHISTNNESLKTNKVSSKRDKRVSHYKYTNQKQSNKLDTSKTQKNLGSKCFQKSRSQDWEDDSERAGQRERPKEKKGGEEGDIVLSTGLQHITLKQALNASSERFRDYMPLEPRPMNWSDFIEAAYKLKSELHISQAFWAEACITLGRTGAAICLLLTDQAVQREDNPVTKPAAYFKAMISRAKAGELHLHSSIFGLLKREGEQG